MRADIAIRHNVEVEAREQRALAEHAELALGIDNNLHEIVTSPDEFYPNYATPTPSAELVEWVFQAIRDVSYISDERQERLIDFFNSRLLPISGADCGAVNHSAVLSRSARGAACTSAEGFFYNTLRQVRTGQDYEQPVVRVYHDAAGEALVLRKARDENTGIMLRPVLADGLLVPTGTIVNVDNAAEQNQTGLKTHLHYDAITFLVDDSFPILPRRLSPWAYSSPIDRSGFAVVEDHGLRPERTYNLERGRKIERTSIEDFRGAANKVLTACGVTQP